mmetsp:Transcript_98848/g.304651  ORF Transcript_98848/g.304651 Transcript_98848/m.304651 type:complete len:289 (-) Transcript_98848:54-920(-)
MSCSTMPSGDSNKAFSSLSMEFESLGTSSTSVRSSTLVSFRFSGTLLMAAPSSSAWLPMGPLGEAPAAALALLDALTPSCANSSVWYWRFMPRTPVILKAKLASPQAARCTSSKDFTRPYQHRRTATSTSSAALKAGGASDSAARRATASLSDSSVGATAASAMGLPVESTEDMTVGAPGAAASLPRVFRHVWSTGSVVACSADRASPASRPANSVLPSGALARSQSASLKSQGLCPMPRSEASARLNCQAKAQRPRQTAKLQLRAATAPPAPLDVGITPSRTAANQR